MLLIELFEGEIYDIASKWGAPRPTPVYENPSKADIAKIQHSSDSGWIRWLFVEGDLFAWDADRLIHSDVYFYFEDETEGKNSDNYIGAKTGPDGTTYFDGDFGGENRGTLRRDIEYMDKQVIFKRAFPIIKWRKS